MDTWRLCNETFCKWFCNIHLKITWAWPQTSASVLDIIQSGLWSNLMSSWMAHGLTCFLWHGGSPVWRKTPICTMSENRLRSVGATKGKKKGITSHHSLLDSRWMQIKVWVNLHAAQPIVVSGWLALNKNVVVDYLLNEMYNVFADHRLSSCWASQLSELYLIIHRATHLFTEHTALNHLWMKAENKKEILTLLFHTSQPLRRPLTFTLHLPVGIMWKISAFLYPLE